MFIPVERCLRDSKRPVSHTPGLGVRVSGVVILSTAHFGHAHTQALRGIVVGEGMEVEEAVELVTKEKNINVKTHPRYALYRDSGKELALLHVVSSLSLCSTETSIVTCG